MAELKEDKLIVKEKETAMSQAKDEAVSTIKWIWWFLKEELPDFKYAIAHGKLPSKTLEERISNFYDKKIKIYSLSFDELVFFTKHDYKNGT